MCKTNIQQDFITRTIQKYNKDVTKKCTQKLMLNILKVMYDCTFIHTHWAPSSKSLLKKLPIYMCPMFIHVELIVNYELIENDLKFN